MSRPEKQSPKSKTIQGQHLPSHVTDEIWQDLIRESENFLLPLSPKVSQLWHHVTHVAHHSRDDPGCQAIASKDFRLFKRSEEVRRHVYETCRRATSQSGIKGKHIPEAVPLDEDIIAASYGAYSAHVVVDDMRTDEGDELRTKLYRNFIFAIDKQYKLFRRLSVDRTKVYWDVILGCWAPRNDAFCVSFFPCPWIQEDTLKWQTIFHPETNIQTEHLYTGANGILTNTRICQLFLRGVLVIIPTDNIDRHGYDEYRIRVMDPDYPHLDDLIFEEGQAPQIDSADVEGTTSHAKKKRGYSPHPRDLIGLKTLTFRGLDNRVLSFRGASGNKRPSIPLLYWQFATAMVKNTWQIPTSKLSEVLPALHIRWSEVWMAFNMGEYLNLGTTLAFSYLLNNPSGGSAPSPSSKEPTSSRSRSFTFTISNPGSTGPTISDRILSLGCPTAFRLSELTPTSREDNIHYSPILLLCNEILQRTPHPDDTGPNAWTVESKPVRRVAFSDEPLPSPTPLAPLPTTSTTKAKVKEPVPMPVIENGDPAGIVTRAYHRCNDCTAFERAVIADVDRRDGNSDELAFVHHHVKEPSTPEEERSAGIGSSYDYDALWDHRELKSKDKKKKARTVFDDCQACQARMAVLKERRAKVGLGNGVFVFSHHVPSRDPGAVAGDSNYWLKDFESLKVG